MTFAEKLKRLMNGRDQVEVARSIKVSPTVLSNYLNRKTMPRVDIALRLSKLFGCSLSWFVDPARDWEDADRTAAIELADHYVAAALRVRYDISKAEKTNWLKVAKAIGNIQSDAVIPSAIEQETELARSLMQARRTLQRFDVCHFPQAFIKAENVPDGDLMSLRIDSILNDISNRIEKTHGFKAVVIAMNLRMAKSSGLDFPSQQVDELEKMLRLEMERLEVPITVPKKKPKT